MGKATLGQSLNLFSVLANNADWESLDSKIIQETINNPRKAGEHFTAFLKNFEKAFSNLHETCVTLPATEGVTGQQWAERLDEGVFRLRVDAKNLLLSAKFKPTNGVIYEVVIISGYFWKTHGEKLTLGSVRAEAMRRKLRVPTHEVACLLCTALTEHQFVTIGSSGVCVMHKPTKGEFFSQQLLNVSRNGGSRELSVRVAKEDDVYHPDNYFAFIR